MKVELEMIKKGDVVMIGNKFGLVLSDVKCKTTKLKHKNTMYVIPTCDLTTQDISLSEIPKDAKVWGIEAEKEMDG